MVTNYYSPLMEQGTKNTTKLFQHFVTGNLGRFSNLWFSQYYAIVQPDDSTGQDPRIISLPSLFIIDSENSQLSCLFPQRISNLSIQQSETNVQLGFPHIF